MRNGREDSLPPRLCRGIRVLINKRGFVHRKITRAEIREGGVLGIRSYRIDSASSTMAPFIVDFFRRLEQGNSKTREILATKSREILILIDIASRGRNVNRERGCALRSWSRFLPHRGRVFVRVHKQTCCYRPSPPLSLSRIGADFYRRGDSRGKFIKPPPPLPSVGTQAARAFTGIKGRKGYSIRILRSKLSERLFYRVQYVPSPSFFSYR